MKKKKNKKKKESKYGLEKEINMCRAYIYQNAN